LEVTEINDLRIRFPKITDKIIIPSLKGRGIKEAEFELNTRGLVVEKEKIETGRYEPGIVVKQSPAAGTIVAKGTRVYLAHAVKGEVEVEYRLPNFKGWHIKEAESELRGRGLVPEIEKIETDKFKPGIVVKQYPPAGTRVGRGTRVRLAYAVEKKVKERVPLY
jgi:beta-lactam-binding protein with PASTA domain